MSHLSPDFMQTHFASSSPAAAAAASSSSAAAAAALQHHASQPLQHATAASHPQQQHPFPNPFSMNNNHHHHHLHQLQIPAFSRLAKGSAGSGLGGGNNNTLGGTASSSGGGGPPTSPSSPLLGVSPRNIYSQDDGGADADDDNDSSRQQTRPGTPSSSLSHSSHLLHHTPHHLHHHHHSSNHHGLGAGAGASASSHNSSSSRPASPSIAATPQPPPPASAPAATPGGPPVLDGTEIYAAVYSGIGVYETMANSVAVMRRKSDGYLNATQILKVAGVDKGRRTKILDKEVMTGEHEKVQGGYGKYQGTWVPFQRGVQLAVQYGVENLLQPLFDFAFPLPGRSDHTPTKEQVYAANRDLMKQRALASGGTASTSKSSGSGTELRKRKMTTRPNKRMAEVVDGSDLADDESATAAAAAAAGVGSARGGTATSSPPAPSNKRLKGESSSSSSQAASSATAAAANSNHNASVDAYPETNAEKYRAMLMAMFVHEDPLYIPDILSGPTLPTDLDLDIVIDEQGHTSLHWAAALARVNVVRVLLQKGADIRSANNDGETALIRAVRVTNNYDTQTFPELLDLLHPVLHHVDAKHRTVLHHIALTAAMEGRVAASRYYVECFLEWVARHGGNFSAIVDVQDSAGDTALNVAARIGNRNLVEQLMDVGADATLENRAGLRPMDFGCEDIFAPRMMMMMGAGQNGGAGPNNNGMMMMDGGAGGPAQQHNEMMMMMDRGAAQQQQQQQPVPGEHTSRVVFPSIRTDEEDAALALSAVASATKGREIASAVQQMVDEMSTTFTDEMKLKAEQLDEVRNQLRLVTRELSEVRKQNHVLRRENSAMPDMVARIRGLEQVLGEEMARAAAVASAAASNNAANGADGNGGGSGSGGVGGMVSFLSSGYAAAAAVGHQVEGGGMVAEAGTGDESTTTTQAQQLAHLRSKLAEKEQLERMLRSEIIRLRCDAAAIDPNPSNNNNNITTSAPDDSRPSTTPSVAAATTTTTPLIPAPASAYRSTTQAASRTEMGCKKIIAACCRVGVEQVDELLGPLLTAVESDADVDVGAVAAFMMSVKRKEGRV
ncbi:transcriptional regulator swi6 [Geranomyces variabilis]|uniref:Transcriptional regulator swi6 n=1 Tax=Geranomyces variabilis TaxID=109894 RepID=A0AAD5TEL7_9FUNG|nr:transcriptional regulator swi6 [Geranomyces variabilis]